MRNLALGITLAIIVLVALWSFQHDTPGPCHAPAASQPVASELPSFTPPEAAPEPAGPRGTTWLVLQVEREGSELVKAIHKDALPYAPGPPTADAGAVRYRLLEPDGSELTGPASWPRLCPCEAERSHNRGCIRQPHSGSVRLRLPRLSGPSTVVIERRSAAGWTPLTTLEVDA